MNIGRKGLYGHKFCLNNVLRETIKLDIYKTSKKSLICSIFEFSKKAMAFIMKKIEKIWDLRKRGIKEIDEKNFGRRRQKRMRTNSIMTKKKHIATKKALVIMKLLDS